MLRLKSDSCPRRSQPMDSPGTGTLNAYIFALEECRDTHYLRIDNSEGPILIKMFPGKNLLYSYDGECWHRVPLASEEYNYLEDLLMVHGGIFVERG